MLFYCHLSTLPYQADFPLLKNSSANVYTVKAQWNTIILDGSIPKGEVERMMDNSFMLMVSKMTKKDQQSILVHL